MRRTIHLVTADDAPAWRARHDSMLRGRVLGTYRRELDGVDLDELAAAGRAVMADGEPRSTADLARVLSDRWPAPGPRALGEMVIAALVPMVQLPPRGLWRTKAGVRNVAILGYQDRSRIIDDAHRGLSVAGARVVLVDGRVAATWTVDGGTVTVTPLRGLTRTEYTALTEEGQSLAVFLSDHGSDRVRIV